MKKLFINDVDDELLERLDRMAKLLEYPTRTSFIKMCIREIVTYLENNVDKKSTFLYKRKWQ